MKVIVMCNCGNSLELKSETNGQHAYFSRNARGRFRADNHGIEIEPNLSLSLNEQFVSELSETESDDEVILVLEDQMLDNIDTDPELKELRIDCTKCGSYIVLTGFE